MSRRARARRLRRRPRRHSVLRLLAMAAVVVAAFGAVALSVGAGVAYHYYQGCDLNDLKPVTLGQNSFVYASGGQLLGVIPSTHNRQPVAFKQMSPWLIKGTVAVEDHTFYSNNGVDLRSIARAAWIDLRSGQTLQGGSTLTQQLVRNLYANADQHTFARKLKEACLAVKLNRRWRKDRILSTYLNQVYYGSHAYGVEAAAHTYFARPASQLTLAEAALIAGLPQSPSGYDPLYHPAQAKARRDEVLEALARYGYLSPARARAAERQPLGLHPGQIYFHVSDPLFFNYVYDQLVARYGPKTVSEGGLKVVTTLDPRLERLAYASIRDTLYQRTDPAAALVAIDPRSGQIKAMAAWVPGRKRQPVFNLASQGRRQAGSSFKVFALAAAIEHGIDPNSTYYLSAPFTYLASPAAKPWYVQTDTFSYLGSVSLARALALSDNTVYARLGLDLGPWRVTNMAHRLGVRSPLKAVPSAVLGTNPVSPLDMASAYATIDALGMYRPPTAIKSVTFPDGQRVTFAAGKPHRALDPAVAYALIQAMQQVVQYGTGTAAALPGYQVAGKTGTTTDFTDGWFVGFVPRLATASWVGYPSGEIPMRDVHGTEVFGGTFPAQIWHGFMQPALDPWPAQDWTDPGRTPTYRPWRGQYQWSSAGSSAAGYSSSSSGG